MSDKRLVSASDIAKLLKSSHSEAAKQDSMVYVVFADGEIVLTKGGELFGARTLHQDAQAFITQDAVNNFNVFVEDATLPRPLGYVGACVETRERAYEIRAQIAEWVKDMIDAMVRTYGFGAITPKHRAF